MTGRRGSADKGMEEGVRTEDRFREQLKFPWRLDCKGGWRRRRLGRRCSNGKRAKRPLEQESYMNRAIP